MQVVDVDFRWAMRDYFDRPPVKVLQWRKKIKHQLSDNVPAPSQTMVIWPQAQFSEPQWTDWQDVKTEEE